MAVIAGQRILSHYQPRLVVAVYVAHVKQHFEHYGTLMRPGGPIVFPTLPRPPLANILVDHLRQDP